MKLLNLKSFYIGIFCVPFLFVCCQTASKNYTSNQGLPLCSYSDSIRNPTNSVEVVAIVNEAISKNLTTKAYGARHSNTDIICIGGIPIDMTSLKSSQMNSDNTATFGAGVTVLEAGEFLLNQGRALRNTPAYGNITLGGAIGTGAHGSTLKYNSSISEQVVQMTIVDGQGNIQVISDPIELQSFKVHLGLLGIVVDVTLYTVPLYKILAQNYIVSDDVLTNGVALGWLTTDQIMFHWFPIYKTVVVLNLTFIPFTTTGNARNNIVPPTYDLYNIGATTFRDTAYNLISTEAAVASTLGYTILHALELVERTSLLTLTPFHVPYYTEDGITFADPAIGYPQSMLASTCTDGPAGLVGTACFWDHGDVNANLTYLDNEFGIAVSNLSAFITATKDIVDKTPTAFPMHGIVIRFSKGSDIYMSTAYKRDTAHIGYLLLKPRDPYNDAPGSLAGFQTISQTLTKTFNGRSHWGKSGLVYHGSEMLNRKLDPLARQNFVAAMNKYDPNGFFLNDFGRRIKQTGNKINSDPLSTHCGLLDNCFCSSNSDCADSQTCTSITGYNNYTVCKTINENPVLLDQLSFPSMPDLLDWLNNTLPGLVTDVLNDIPVVGPILDTVLPGLG